MNSKIFFTGAAALLCVAGAMAQEKKDPPSLTEVWKPEPRVITPGASASSAPSDAIVLFDGKSTDAWVGTDGGPIKWDIADGAMTVKGGSGEITSKEKFGDCQLHIEWRTPAEVKGDGQGRGNSGIFLMGKYELQVLDSYNNRTYSNGQAGSIYKQLIPLVNASRKPGEWQTYDVIFTAPRFNEDGTVKMAARITVIHNGVLVQNNATLIGSTQYIGIASYEKHSDSEPIKLQDHGNPVSYRNIWVRKL
ncbi:DUF1080 domain-containing protein [Danxiaibacter flavus]|uniref:DUF1080 domain-containing protein n=1 Tax=Danxiaibacter flavus TaxID=3049108 RepID=A0ABV3ZAG4_9BACT|nr:DUF1080 domain-containing protein [Chitinophagaceae bacterium DXS]